MSLKVKSFPRVWLTIFLLIPLTMTINALHALARAGAQSRSLLMSAITETPFPLRLAPSIAGSPFTVGMTFPILGLAIEPQFSFRKLFSFRRGDPMNLIIPVEGVRPEDLRDTFNDSRSEGRVHHAIDIMAPHETPVLAATDGEILRLTYNKRGGNTIYQIGEDKKTIFYYAHLDSYADELTKGERVRQGDVIGYVGCTGNAGPGNYHLHFSIWTITDPKKYWQGEDINPYPILRSAPSFASSAGEHKKRKEGTQKAQTATTEPTWDPD